MSLVKISMGEDYWEAFKLQDEDLEFLYNYLLEIETPLTSQELVDALVVERIRQRKLEIERQRTSGGDLYQPKGTFKEKQKLIFPGWGGGTAMSLASGRVSILRWAISR